MAQRLQETARADTSCHHLNFTDTETGRITSQNKWTIVQPQPGNEYQPSTLGGDHSASEKSNRVSELFDQQIHDISTLKSSESKETFVCDDAITGMTVLPTYKVRGAESILVRWGTQQADTIGSEVTIYSIVVYFEQSKPERLVKCIEKSGTSVEIFLHIMALNTENTSAGV